jgi:hypothetical protein
MSAAQNGRCVQNAKPNNTGLTAMSIDRTIVAEFQKEASGRLVLFALTVFEKDETHFSRTLYDVDWSKRYGYLFDQSGFGGGSEVEVAGVYFLAGPIDVKITEKPTALVSSVDQPPWRSPATKKIRERNRTRRLKKLPKEFQLEDGADLLDWLRCNGIEQDGVWCSACRDWVPGEELCRHTWWCDDSYWYSTPDDRPCAHCINGRCRNFFEITPCVNSFDNGSLWFWAGQPELTWHARLNSR